MGFKFRKSIKIAPGLRVNVTSKGVSSVSVGGKGGTFNVNKKGVKATASIPRTGLSHTSQVAKFSRPAQGVHQSDSYAESQSREYRQVSFILGFGIFLVPVIFSWFLLRSGHTKTSRLIGFSWLMLYLYVNITK